MILDRDGRIEIGLHSFLFSLKIGLKILLMVSMGPVLIADVDNVQRRAEDLKFIIC